MECMDESHREKVRKDRNYIMLLADILRLTALQNISQRGHRENDDNTENINKGNFLEILDLLKIYDPEVPKSFNAESRNYKYTHHKYQNALIDG